MNHIRVVEIGGTHIRRAEVSDGQVFDIIRKRTAEVLAGDVLASLDKFCRENFNNDIRTLVILVAGPTHDNIVELLPNFPEFPKNINLSEKLNLSVPILVFNDMTAAVTGMAELLKKQNIHEPFWGLTWSTGLGGQFWDGEKIGKDMEIGHEIILSEAPDAPICGCGQKGDAESLLGGANMSREIGKSLDEVTEAYQKREPWAINFYQKKVALMAQLLKRLNEIQPARLFCFKGSVALNLLQFDEILKQFDQKIVLSPEPEKDSFLGAAQLAKKAL